MTETNGTGKRQKKIDTNALIIEGRALIALVVIVVIFATLSDNYLNWSNLVVMTRHVAFNAILALGMLMVILHGGIDLSVGSVVGLSGVVAGALLEGYDMPFTEMIAYPAVWVVVLISLAVGALAGAVNGFLVTRLRVAPFITTLGMLYVARGAALIIADGRTYPRLQGSPELGNTGFNVIGLGSFLGIPMGVWIMVAFTIVASVILTRTAFGRWLYAIGGNQRAAELSGVPVKKVVTRVYIFSGVCAAAVGLILASELTAATPQTGDAFELNAIAAVVIGGAAMAGGRGTVRGTIIGAFVIGFLSDGLVLVGVSTFWQMVIKGLVIIGAVALDEAQQRMSHGRAASTMSRKRVASTKTEPPTPVQADKATATTT